VHAVENGDSRKVCTIAPVHAAVHGRQSHSVGVAMLRNHTLWTGKERAQLLRCTDGCLDSAEISSIGEQVSRPDRS